MEDNNEKVYYDRVHYWGTLTMAVAVLLFLGVNLYLSFVLGYHPGWKAIFTGFVNLAAVVGFTWVNIGDIVMFLMVMGPSATYMSQLTGNIKNMRLPSAIAAYSVLDDEAPQLKRDILASFGVGISVLVNTAALILLVVAGKYVLELLPTKILSGLDYIVPAMFGAILAQFSFRNIPVAGVSMFAVLCILQVAAIPPFLRAVASILLAVFLNLLIEKYKRRRQKSKAKERDQ